jgi:hypothetical protein
MSALARNQASSLARRGQRALKRQQAHTAPGAGRKTSLKTMLGLGSQVLDRLQHLDPHYRSSAQATWKRMQIAWDSGQRADQRAALVGLQSVLTQWTAEDANVAGDKTVQGYRKKLHLVLDH